MHASVGGAHGLIEAIASLQQREPEKISNLDSIPYMNIRLSHPVYAHDGWKAERPMTATGGQTNAGYIAAVQLVDKQVLLAQFANSQLDRDVVWSLISKIDCEHGPEFDHPSCGCGAYIVVRFNDELVLEKIIDQPRGFDFPPSPMKRSTQNGGSLPKRSWIMTDVMRSKILF